MKETPMTQKFAVAFLAAVLGMQPIAQGQTGGQTVQNRICLAEQLCGMRTATVCAALAQLSQQGLVARQAKGYQCKPP